MARDCRCEFCGRCRWTGRGPIRRLRDLRYLRETTKRGVLLACRITLLAAFALQIYLRF